MLTEDRPGTERTALQPGRMPVLAGAELEVPLATGQSRRYVNLDFAASSPAMQAVVDEVTAFLPWYSSVHRGTGWTSQVSTRAYESARRAVHGFVGARETDEVIFVRNSTEALNLLAHCIPLRPDQVVLSTALEHHANMLPWRRRGKVIHLDPPDSPEALLDDVRRALDDRVWPVGLLAVTGASNVTGEVFPLRELAELAHEHDALIAVDAAQLAPHRAIDMVAMGIDCLALSGHKMYAPFGAGALVAPAALLAQSEPLLAGGGAVSYVTLEDVQWAALPDRLEAGSPNVVGAVALGAAAAALTRTGMAHVAAHEKRLLRYVEGQLEDIPGLRRLRLWSSDGVDRLGVCTFTLKDMHHALVAAALSAEHGVGVRHGCFCAHPYIVWLLGVSAEQSGAIRERLRRGEHHDIPGAVRASFGIGTTVDHIDRFVAALRTLVERGPQLQYREDPASGDYVPVDDRRELPAFELLPALAGGTRGPACGQF